jgi:hypothetical protein
LPFDTGFAPSERVPTFAAPKVNAKGRCPRKPYRVKLARVRTPLGRPQAVFLMLARSQQARERALRTLRRVRGGWSVRIGGPIKGQTRSFLTVRDAVTAVDAHYDERLYKALHAPGWKPHLTKVVTSALHDGNRVSLRSVVQTVWRRRKWPHTGRHVYKTVRGVRTCTLCASSLRLQRFND